MVILMFLHFCTTINQEAQKRNYFLSGRLGQVLIKNHFTNNIIYTK